MIITPFLPVDQPGTAAVVPIAVLVVAQALWNTPTRAASSLVGLAAALTVCALHWPPSPYVAGGAFLASRFVNDAAGRLWPRRSARRPVGLFVVTAVAGLAAANHALDLPSSGALMTYMLVFGLPMVGVVHWLFAGEHVVIDALVDRWERWRLDRLAAQGLRPLADGEAPVFYVSVDADGDDWTYDVRVGQDIVETGRRGNERKAARAAAHACLRHTFRPPVARYPGAVHVLGYVHANPYQRQVQPLFPLPAPARPPLPLPPIVASPST
jgi:hypothetical protein